MTIPSASKVGVGFGLGSKVNPQKFQAKPSGNNSNIDIIDIRHDAVEFNLKEDILNSLTPQSGPKNLPTLLLYDERGLQLFEEVSAHLHLREEG